MGIEEKIRLRLLEENVKNDKIIINLTKYKEEKKEILELLKDSNNSLKGQFEKDIQDITLVINELETKNNDNRAILKLLHKVGAIIRYNNKH